MIDVVLSMVKYWVRLNDTKNKITDNLLLETIKENKAMVDKNRQSWLTCLKTILFEIGMPEIYLHPAKCTRKKLKIYKPSLNQGMYRNGTKKFHLLS